MSYANHFSERNIPFGIASSGTHTNPQAATRVHDTVLFLSDVAEAGTFSQIANLPKAIFGNATLNEFAALPKSIHQAVREAIQAVLGDQGLDGFVASSKAGIEDVTLHLPVDVHDFTDFSCSEFHVRNARRILDKCEGLPPSFERFPIGYQGRTASIVPSGTEIERPRGYFRNADSVAFAPSEKVDFEVEFAAVIGKPLAMRHNLNVADVQNHIFGYILLNDWSARDIQGFEMIPLGPFNGKSMGTTISPWIVTTGALEPFQAQAPPQKLDPTSHLVDSERKALDIILEVSIVTGSSSTTVGVCPVKSLYWTPQQMIAHSVSSGSALRTGDLLATGTVSGETPGSLGCLLEATEGSRKPLKLDDGSERGFIEDGDTVSITGYAGGPSSGVGFGECVGRLVPSRIQ